jgi:Acyl-CoA synthetases (AMP-forming)/AMP-acid ligases II
MTEDGGLVILDRVKDVIKSGGEWISSSILEAAISELPWVSLVAVIGVKNERWGERPIAVIKPSSQYRPRRRSRRS